MDIGVLDDTERSARVCIASGRCNDATEHEAEAVSKGQGDCGGPESTQLVSCYGSDKDEEVRPMVLIMQQWLSRRLENVSHQLEFRH